MRREVQWWAFPLQWETFSYFEEPAAGGAEYPLLCVGGGGVGIGVFLPCWVGFPSLHCLLSILCSLLHVSSMASSATFSCMSHSSQLYPHHHAHMASLWLSDPFIVEESGDPIR